MAAALAVVLVGATAWARPAPAQDAPAPVAPRNGPGFKAVIGAASFSGDLGDLMEFGIPAEGGVWYQHDWLRVDVSVRVASHHVVEPFDDRTISQVEFHGQLSYFFLPHARLRPFAGLRAGTSRFKPEGALFDPTPPDPDTPPGENPAPRRSGFTGGVEAGVEYWMNRNLGLHLSGVYSIYELNEFDVPILGITDIGGGSAAAVYAGLVWAP